MKKIITVIGARPQFIKAAAVSRIIRNSGIQEMIIHTGQHFDENMSAVFFEEMEIPAPDFHLEINSLSHGAMTGRMLEKIEDILKQVNPDTVMVYGDTNSTLAGALAAAKLHIPVAHVEAGLRSFNMEMPEEINRILTDRISGQLFCPTDQAVENLRKEGFENFNVKIYQVGDVMYDAALFYGKKSAEHSAILQKLDVTAGEYIVCTIHRQENTDDPDNLRSIVAALNEINKKIRVVLPLHPRTRKILQNNNISIDFDTIDPVGYFDIVELLKNCRLVVTDSGGMQKEAFFFQKYCITLRKETEWIELVNHGYNFLTGSETETILSKFEAFIHKSFVRHQSLYGEGNAAEKIVAIMKSSV